ncbi:peptidase inhibitor family I36 protein [Amycolatopsis nigrescens]|uniref:peptidase inhibitor family I36 protein n=1 Tax=Amycolatopsis nigrescens TaxID=381445 RepID=UPI00036B4462|nr:peptidase inhibitor family I36 protein [Amycolatopsis nigrescens]
MFRNSSTLRARLPRVLVLAAFGLLCGGGIAQATTFSPAAPASPPEFSCQNGEFCAWSGEFYADSVERLDLRTANPGECIPLTGEVGAHSFANRMSRDVTVYQGEDCSTEGDFTTYPGHGTFVPQAHFLVRAIQIWD